MLRSVCTYCKIHIIYQRYKFIIWKKASAVPISICLFFTEQTQTETHYYRLRFNLSLLMNLKGFHEMLLRISNLLKRK
jgi:hypothetical protein